MDRARILEIVRAEFGKHHFDTFVENPPSIAQGGQGVVVPGCVNCKVRLHTVEQFVSHLSERVQEAVRRELDTT
jgi:hypothetical protein